MGVDLGVDKKVAKTKLFEMFPYGYVKQTCKIVRSSVILLLPLFITCFMCTHCRVNYNTMYLIIYI
jgi:hypothetical protein